MSAKLPSGLTVKQEMMCQGLAKGMTQSDAYREAYDAAGMAQETIWARASELAKDSKVAARVEELLAEQLEVVRMTEEAWDATVAKAMLAGGDDPKAQHINAMALFAKRRGWLVEKTEDVTKRPTLEETIERRKQLEKQIADLDEPRLKVVGE